VLQSPDHVNALTALFELSLKTEQEAGCKGNTVSANLPAGNAGLANLLLSLAGTFCRICHMFE
jgi:hypothetical protein